jgi:hypothetical protein
MSEELRRVGIGRPTPVRLADAFNRSGGPVFTPNSSLLAPKIMFKQFISKIPGADVYMVGSFVTFLAFFILVGLYLVLVDKTYIRQMSRMPLDESSTD